MLIGSLKLNIFSPRPFFLITPSILAQPSNPYQNPQEETPFNLAHLRIYLQKIKAANKKESAGAKRWKI
jgi:hypothetical protein